ncbi:MAG: ACP phosphodiesterase [Draconibacterium sp.]|nr:ACP phosphodiesterase [Draconibacterium sp.]
MGNFIGDYIKGNKYQDYPEEIAKGIILHRKIDTFTDRHFKHKEAKLFFRDNFGLYSGIVVDFFYDHFLAKNWNDYSEDTLRAFSKKVHAILLSNFRYLPTRVQGFLPFLIQNKRLESYATVDGIINSMRIMANYTSLPAKSDEAKNILEKNYQSLEQNFSEFMEEIISFIQDETGIRNHKKIR